MKDVLEWTINKKRDSLHLVYFSLRCNYSKCMKTRYKTIIFITILIVLVAVIFGFPEFFKYTFFDPRLQKIYPDKSEPRYAVLFNQGALQGDSTHFGIINEGNSESKLIILGPLRFVDIPLAFQRVIVSSDGSVVASESLFRPYNQEDWIPYWLAYDFTNSISYGGAWYPKNEDPNLIEVRGKVIQELLQSRGGIGQEFGYTEILEKENKLSYMAWKRWQKQVNKAKNNCQPWVNN